jgi:hypothetical protein
VLKGEVANAMLSLVVKHFVQRTGYPRYHGSEKQSDSDDPYQCRPMNSSMKNTRIGVSVSFIRFSDIECSAWRSSKAEERMNHPSTGSRRESCFDLENLTDLPDQFTQPY